MWDQFSNALGNVSNWFGSSTADASTGYTPATGFSLQQSAMPSTFTSPAVSVGSNPYLAQSPDWFSMGGAFGNGQTGGWAMPAIQGLQTMFNWSQGNKAMGLAKDQFNLSKEMAQKNLANQTSLLNTAMQDRQNARRSASSSYQDTSSYMSERGL